MTLVELAKRAIEAFVKDGKVIEPPASLPRKFLEEKSGTFVTIERTIHETNAKPEYKTDAKKLRGCIGTYLPMRENIAKEVIHNAIAAATEDYRFGLIKKEELPYLSYTVYILSQPELVKDISELDPKKFGIIVKTAPQLGPDVVFNGHMPFKSGLLLPDLENVDTVEQQLSIACQKGGINPLKEKIIIYRFEVEKYT